MDEGGRKEGAQPAIALSAVFAPNGAAGREAPLEERAGSARRPRPMSVRRRGKKGFASRRAKVEMRGKEEGEKGAAESTAAAGNAK